jgi:hypothetical protein
MVDMGGGAGGPTTWWLGVTEYNEYVHFKFDIILKPNRRPGLFT